MDLTEDEFFSKSEKELFDNTLYLPFPTAGGSGKGANVVRAGVKGSKFAAFAVASKYGIKTYDALRTLIAGKGFEAHHLIEKRFADLFGVAKGKIPAIVLTKAEHLKFSILWRREIGLNGWKTAITTSTATIDDVKAAAKKIYKGYPELLKSLESYLK